MAMNGFLCVDARSGQLLHSRAFRPGFGIYERSADSSLDSIRLASTLFAWHVNAESIAVHIGGLAQPESLSMYSIGDVAMHMHADQRARLLLVAITSAQISHEHGLAIVRHVADAYVAQLESPNAEFLRSKLSRSMHEVLSFRMPLVFLRSCLSARGADVVWAWALSLGKPAEQAAVLSAWASRRGTAWPPMSPAQPTRQAWGGRLLFRARSEPVARASPASEWPRTLGPWHVEGSTVGSDASEAATMVSAPGALSLLPTADSVPSLLSRLDPSGLGALSPAASCELTASVGVGVLATSYGLLVLRRGCTLLVAAFTHERGGTTHDSARHVALANEMHDILAELESYTSSLLTVSEESLGRSGLPASRE